MSSHTRFAYRPEIDGLRAIAVVPVILFHAGIALFSGGFVGVDVFFVISGYLITSLIQADCMAGRFSIRDFYERRARRIIPALSLVLLVSLAFAWIVAFPEPLKTFGDTLMAVSGFASNIYFWRHAGYFNPGSTQNPLLHTWSLAVEEQFYIGFPLLLALLWRIRLQAWAIRVVLLFTLLSLALAEWAVYVYPTAAFYLAPTRIWELLIGSLLALWQPNARSRMPLWATNTLSAVGLILILVANFAFNERVPFPSLYTLVPVVGAGLCLEFADARTWVGSLLKLPLLTGIGLISYSLYLWHQPVLAFAHPIGTNISAQADLPILLLLILVLSYLTWRFVETPFRDRNRVSARTIFTTTAVCGVLFTGAGAALHFGQGFPSGPLRHLTPEVDRALAAAKSYDPKIEACTGDEGRFIPPAKACVFGNPNAKPTIALWGDSHAAALTSSLGKLLNDTGASALNFTFLGCPPSIGLRNQDKGPDHECPRYNLEVVNFLRANPSIETVVVASRWTLYLEGTRFNNQEGYTEEGRPETLTDDNGFATDKERRLKLTKSFTGAIHQLLSLGKRVVLIYPTPEVALDVPDTLARLRRRGIDRALSTRMDVFEERNRATLEMLDSLGSHNRITRVYPAKTLCNTFVAGRCVANYGDKIFYRDDDHLSIEGADLVLERLPRNPQPGF